jgi:hypothetical protein
VAIPRAPAAVRAERGGAARVVIVFAVVFVLTAVVVGLLLRTGALGTP